MEQFDDLIREMAEKEEMTMPDGFDERMQAALDGLPPKMKKRKPGAVKVALIAAAACLLLAGTAFAANAATGGLVFDKYGRIVLGRFEKGLLVDGNGDRVDPAQLDDEQLESGEYRVIYPEDVNGVELTEEDGRVILYGRNGLIEVRLDITDELLENGTFHYYEERDTDYWLSLTVYSVVLEEYAQYDPSDGGYPLVYEGAAYLTEGSGCAPNDHGGTFGFEFHDMRFSAVNGFCGKSFGPSGSDE